MFHSIFQNNKPLCRGTFRTQSNVYGADYMEIIWTRAENFNLVERVKKNYIIWNFSFRAEFPRLFSETISEAAVRRCPIKKLFLKIPQNSRERLCQSFFFNKVANFSSYWNAKKQEAKSKAHLYCKWASFKGTLIQNWKSRYMFVLI